MSHYDKNLDKNEANYVPLSPLTFLRLWTLPTEINLKLY